MDKFIGTLHNNNYYEQKQKKKYMHNYKHKLVYDICRQKMESDAFCRVFKLKKNLLICNE